jgi:hypothetical protein
MEAWVAATAQRGALEALGGLGTGGGIGYGPSTPCDHFGVGTSKTPTHTNYSWLTETSPGSSSLAHVTANLPALVINVTPAPPPPPGNPQPRPKVVMQVQSPAPPNPAEPQFGIPEWVKVVTTEYQFPVALEDLLGGNGIVPQDAAKTEIEWQSLQTDPGDPLAGMIENGGDASPVLGGNIGVFIGDQNVAVNLNGVFNGPPQVAAPEPPSLALVAWG